MRLAIVGSTLLGGNAEAKRIIVEALDRYQPTVFVSGGASGVDTMAELEARLRGIPCTIFHPRNKRWAPAGYKERNLAIAQNCDALVRISAAGATTYGSGWTRDRAKELGKPTEEFVVALAGGAE